MTATPLPKRRRRNFSRTASLLLLLVPGTFAATPPEARDTRPGYSRSQAQRPASTLPGPRSPMPEPLRRKPVADQAAAEPAKSGDSRPVGAAATRPGASPARPGIDRRDDALTEYARSTAEWAAERQLTTRGTAEYYRAGFFLGQRDALADPALGTWDFREGRRFALGDPDARRSGLAEGEAAADQLAWAEAEARIRDQFMNLGAEPRFDARAALPSWAAGPRSIAAPTVDEIFRDYPLSQFTFADDRPAYIVGLPLDAARLRGYAAYTEFFDSHWDDPAAGFQVALANPAHARFFRSLPDAAERQRFRIVFDASFLRRLSLSGDRRLDRAFDRGFDDGYAYGAFVHQELDYRRGYFEGFTTALDRATDEGFRRAFPGSYEDAYRALYREWMENPKPEIGQVLLVDANDDGIFEPGERVIVESELINYGGAEGLFTIRVQGGVLATGADSERSIRLPARSAERDLRLMARIDSATPNRTRTSVAVNLADRSASVPLFVTRPLQFVPGGLFIERRNLEGTVRVEVEVENQSRLPRSGSIELHSFGNQGRPLRADVSDLAPGRTTTVALSVHDLPVLDLIAGDVTLELRAESGGTEQDSVTYQVPGVVRDLSNNDLLEYVVALSRDRHASPSEVARARSLFLSRLREDWARAVSQSGNPYKADYQSGGTRTSLGELVQTVASVRGAADNDDVFAGLSGEVSTLAEELPGAHPLLRKYMRRLAHKLP